MEKVSVIIPTYNRKDKVLLSIKSVLDQSYDNLEIIVVDDCSTDGTEEVLKNINDTRVVYHRLSHNQGAAHARNYGVMNANSEIVAFNDTGDKWSRDKLKKQMKYLADNPNDVLVYCRYNRQMSEDLSITVPPIERPLNELKGDILKYLLGSNTIGPPTLMTYKDVFLNIGGFSETYNALEDWDFAIRMAKNGNIGFIDEVLVEADYSEGGLSSQANISNYYDARCRMLAEHIKEIQQFGLFDIIVQDIFQRADQRGILEQVKQMLMLYIKDMM